MGDFVKQTMEHLTNVPDAQYRLGISDGNGTSKDAKLNLIEDSLARVEWELAGYDCSHIKPRDMIGKSFDSAFAAHLPQLQHYDMTPRYVEHGDLDLFPRLQRTSTMPVGAKQQDFRLDDFAGNYSAINSAATLDQISVSGQSFSIKSQMGGASISWTQEEIDQAAYAGVPLDTQLVRGIRLKYIEYIHDIMIYGDNKRVGLIGTVTESDVSDTVVNPNSAAGAALKYWINKTGIEQVKDLITARNAIATATLGRWGGSRAGMPGNPASFDCLISQSAQQILTQTYMTTQDGGDRPMTVWAYLQTPEGMIETGITNYIVLASLNTAFGSQTTAGFMLLPQSVDAYSFEKPLDLTPKPVQFSDLKMTVPYYDYFAGLKLIRDAALISYKSITA